MDDGKPNSGDAALLSGEDAFFMYDLFRHHPTANEKIAKGGCVAVGFGLNAAFPDTNSFYLVMRNGEQNPFSAFKCIEAAFLKARQEVVAPFFLDSRPPAARYGATECDRLSSWRRFPLSKGYNSSKRKRDDALTFSFEPGCLLHVKGLPGAAGIPEIKEAFGKQFKVK